MADGIDRSSDSPLYAQLAEILRALVEGLPPGSPLPSESELETRYSVSRTVVRQALTDLKYKGLVYGVKGVGSFVAQAKVTEPHISTTTGLSEEMARQGHLLTTKVLDVRVSSAFGPKVESGLELEQGKPVINIERLRYLDGEPLLLNSVWLPLDRFPGLETADLTDRSLYGLLASKYGVTPKTARRTVDVVLANEEEAQYLSMSPGEPLLRIEGCSMDAADVPFEWSIALHRADRAKLAFTVNSFTRTGLSQDGSVRMGPESNDTRSSSQKAARSA